MTLEGTLLKLCTRDDGQYGTLNKFVSLVKIDLDFKVTDYLYIAEVDNLFL